MKGKKPFTHLGGTSGKLRPTSPKPAISLRKAPPPAPAQTQPAQTQPAQTQPGSGITRSNWRYATGVDRYSPQYQYYRDRYGK